MRQKECYMEADEFFLEEVGMCYDNIYITGKNEYRILLVTTHFKKTRTI